MRVFVRDKTIRNILLVVVNIKAEILKSKDYLESSLKEAPKDV
jgi:hypothetical protein